MHNIVISIITLKRPELLERALFSLAQIIVPENTNIEILVVDNDLDGSAYDTVQRTQKISPFIIRYTLESKRGRGYARNKALVESGNSDYLVFVDDDVIVEKDWLYYLYQGALKYNAQMVAGDTAYILPDVVPKWVKQCSFFLPKESKMEVQRLSVASTRNLLVDRRWVKKHDIRFPEQRSGEDTVFTFASDKKGAKIIRYSKARVTCTVNSGRANLKWIFHRAVCNGANRSAIYKQNYGVIKAVILSLYEVFCAGIFAIGALALVVIGKRPWIRFIEHTGMLSGWICGILGLKTVIMANT